MTSQKWFPKMIPQNLHSCHNPGPGLPTSSCLSWDFRKNQVLLGTYPYQVWWSHGKVWFKYPWGIWSRNYFMTPIYQLSEGAKWLHWYSISIRRPQQQNNPWRRATGHSKTCFPELGIESLEALYASNAWLEIANSWVEGFGLTSRLPERSWFSYPCSGRIKWNKMVKRRISEANANHP